MLHYNNAKEALNEACQMTDVRQNPVQYDIASGLYNLTQALQNDMHEIKQTLQKIEVVLRNKGHL